MPGKLANDSRVAIITGGNSGLGYACARSLLQDSPGGRRWNVILACRDLVRAQDAVKRLREQVAGAHVEPMTLDLGSLASVRAFARDLGRRLDAQEVAPLHALVCNAGVQSAEKKTFTSDGFESTFGVNHLGHFLLVNLLLPRLAAPARVAVVASGVHDPAQKTMMPAPAWADPTSLSKGELGPLGTDDSPAASGRRRYATAKLANVYFSYELARRLPVGVTVNAFDPGLMPGTGLARDARASARWLWHNLLPRIIPLLRRLLFANIHTPAESGAALARLIVDPALSEVTGKYFEGAHEIASSTESYDRMRGEALWRASAALTGLA